MDASITQPGRVVALPAMVSPMSTTGGAGFSILFVTRYDTLPTAELRGRIREASLTNAQLDRLVDGLDPTWKKQWLSEPDEPFAAE